MSLLYDKIKFKIFDKSFKPSNGIYGLYRFKEDDKIKMVHHNYEAIRAHLEVDHLLILKQVHGNAVVDSDLIADFKSEPEADAAVVSQPGIALTVQSADCVPILLASADGKVVGAAHCGWRSAFADILTPVIQLMQKKGAIKIDAIIGPAIHQPFYEVDQTFYDLFTSSEEKAKRLFIKSAKEDRYLFDLPGFVKMKLHQLGVVNIINQCEDTYSNPEKFYSYRRDTHLGITKNQPNKTNILSTILIAK